MKSISKWKRVRKEQKQARKIQRSTSKRKKHHFPRKKLTPEQKKRRSQLLTTQKEFKQKRKQLSKEIEETAEIKRIENALTKIFNLEELNLLARATGFIKRSGEITAISFVYIMSFGFFGNGEIALTYLVSGLYKHFKVVVTPQALSKRINNTSSPKFLQAVLRKILEIQIKIGLGNKFTDYCTQFNGIYLQDSSQISLNEKLSEHFKGFGGGASTAALKLDFIYDITKFLVYGIKMTSSTVNDQRNAKEILKYIKTKSLIIRDLGYFTIDCLKKIQAKGAYYLSRLSICTHVYLNKDDKEPLAILDYLRKLHSEGKTSSNIKVYVGNTQRLETRLVAEKVPEHVSRQRAEKYRKKYKKPPSKYYLDWSGYSIFITNIPEEMFSGGVIIGLYKIRWQIELVFKSLKSNIEIDILKGTNKNRIESLVYGKIITLVVTFIIHNYTAHIAKEKEISGDKLTKFLMSDNRLRDAVIQNDISMLLIELGYEIKLVCKQKRKRKTTLETTKEAFELENSRRSILNLTEVITETNFDYKQSQSAA